MIQDVVHKLAIGMLCLLLVACAPAPPTQTPSPTPAADHAAALIAERDPDVPDLPFPDNPDPAQCGIPVVWGDSNADAWLTGMVDGELIQPTVFLYDSNLRLSVTARAPHGSAVRVVLYQANPVLDFYMVEVLDADGVKDGEGWVPGPFLSFSPVDSVSTAS